MRCEPVILPQLPDPGCVQVRLSQVAAVLIKPEGVAAPQEATTAWYDAIIDNAVTRDTAAKWLIGVGEVEQTQEVTAALGKDHRQVTRRRYSLRMEIPTGPNQHYDFLRVLQRGKRPIRFWFFTIGGSAVGGLTGISTDEIHGLIRHETDGHETGQVLIDWWADRDAQRANVGPVSGGPDPTPPVITSYMFYEQLFENQAVASLTWTKNAGVLPTSNEDAQIWVYLDQRKLWPSQYTVTHNTGPGESTITIDSNTHYAGANYEVVAVITS